MRKYYFAIILMGLVLFLSITACKGSGPTQPSLPNAFKITDFQYSNPPILCVNATWWFTFTNNTGDVAIETGTIDWGDGETDDLGAGQLPAHTSREYMSGASHIYPAKGTYTVEITLTASFSNGSLTDTFTKDIVVDK